MSGGYTAAHARAEASRNSLLGRIGGIAAEHASHKDGAPGSTAKEAHIGGGASLAARLNATSAPASKTTAALPPKPQLAEPHSLAERISGGTNAAPLPASAASSTPAVNTRQNPIPKPPPAFTIPPRAAHTPEAGTPAIPRPLPLPAVTPSRPPPAAASNARLPPPAAKAREPDPQPARRTSAVKCEPASPVLKPAAPPAAEGEDVKPVLPRNGGGAAVSGALSREEQRRREILDYSEPEAIEALLREEARMRMARERAERQAQETRAREDARMREALLREEARMREVRERAERQAQETRAREDARMREARECTEKQAQETLAREEAMREALARDEAREREAARAREEARARLEAETAEREKAEREKAEREKAEREKAEREKAERVKAEREKAEREKAEREKAEHEKAEREKAEREKEERRARINECLREGLEQQARTAETARLAREEELRRVIEERRRREDPATGGRAEALNSWGDDGATLHPDDRGYVLEEDCEENARRSTSAAIKSAPTWDAQVPPLHPFAVPDWSSPAGMPNFSNILASRDAILEKQRTFNDPELQRKSQELIAAHLATYARSSRYCPAGSTAGKYVSFSKFLDVPAWPITPPVLALFLHANRRAQAIKTRGNVVGWLRKIIKVCDSLWSAHPGYSELESWPGAQAAVKELLKVPAANSSTPDSTAEQTPPTRKSTRTTTKAEDDMVLDTSEAEDDADEEEEPATDSYDKLVDYARECAHKFSPHPTPGIPAHNQVFPSDSAAYMAIAAAVIPVYGIGVQTKGTTVYCNRHTSGCPFRIHYERTDDGGVRVTDSSIYEHNHDRHPKIVEDPSWRPYIRSPSAREAVQKRDEAVHVRTTLNSSKKRENSPGPPPPPPKKQARQLSTASRPGKLLGWAGSAPTDEAAAESKLANRAASPSGSVELKAALTPTPAPVVPPARRVRFSSTFATPASDPAAFLPDLTAFRTALDPSLAALAGPLSASGIASVRELRLFIQLEPATRMALYEDLHRSSGEAAMLDVDLVDRLEEALGQARAAGWR